MRITLLSNISLLLLGQLQEYHTHLKIIISHTMLKLFWVLQRKCVLFNSYFCEGLTAVWQQLFWANTCRCTEKGYSKLY